MTTIIMYIANYESASGSMYSLVVMQSACGSRDAAGIRVILIREVMLIASWSSP